MIGILDSIFLLLNYVCSSEYVTRYKKKKKKKAQKFEWTLPEVKMVKLSVASLEK